MSILELGSLAAEDPAFLTVGGTYVADLKDPMLDGALYATYVRSTMAHATFTVDVSELVALPGVVGVFSSDDVDLDSCRWRCRC